jgi:hypoxanthine phosphoribosyltransferase
MEQNSNKRFITWEYIDAAVDNIAAQILSSDHQIKHVYGMPRGGLIPTVMLSHKLSIPLFTPGMVISSTTLVVDDICDSGTTMYNYWKYGIPFATIHTKLTASVQPTFHYEVVGDDWIVYPWERADSKPIQDYATKGE